MYICTDTVKAICARGHGDYRPQGGGGGGNKARQYIHCILCLLYVRETQVVTHLLSERVLFTHLMSIVLIQGSLAH